MTEYNYYVPADVFGITYCIIDNDGMIVFEQSFPGFHILQNVVIEDWDNDGQDDIRIRYSEYIDFHDCINEVVFSLKNDRLYPIFLITVEDVLFFQEGYPEKARYIVREYTKTHSDIVIHENTGTVNLDETSPDFGLKTPMHRRSYKEPIVNKTLNIYDIYPHYIPEDDTEED
jgi:hypothetical protein